MIIDIVIIAAIILFDQLIKLAAAGVLSQLPNQTFVFIPGFANFSYVQNSGAAFSMFSNGTLVLTILSIALAAVLFFVLLKTKKYKSMLLRLSLCFIIGGAIGNIIDRLAFGYVRDMINFTFVKFAVFNVADSFVSIGAVLLAIFLIFYWDKVKKRQMLEDKPHE